VPLERHAIMVSDFRKGKLEPYGYPFVIAPCRPPRHHSKPLNGLGVPSPGSFSFGLVGCRREKFAYQRICTEPDIAFIVVVIIDLSSAVIDD
jgi:hypothetical protein